MHSPIIIRQLGITDFEKTCHAMQAFTAARTADTPDELWVTEHNPVYSLGLNRKNVRYPASNQIPVVLTDRGGKITYHGTEQLILYVLLDLQRHHLNIRKLVSLLENAVITLLAKHGVQANAKADAPGVYVNEAKIASLGLRIKNNCCYHGLSLNINMDLAPFKAIDPCGYAGLEVTQTSDLGIAMTLQEAGEELVKLLTEQLANGQKHD